MAKDYTPETILCYKFEESVGYGSVIDYSPNGNNGTVYNTAQGIITQGVTGVNDTNSPLPPFDKCISKSGAAETPTRISTNSVVNINSKILTMCFWVCWPSQRQFPYLIGYNPHVYPEFYIELGNPFVGDDYFKVELSDSEGHWMYSYIVVDDLWVSRGLITPYAWHHFGVVIDRTNSPITMKIYWNGVLQSNGYTYNGNFGGDNFPTYTWHFFGGPINLNGTSEMVYLDDFGLFNKELTEDEINEIMMCGLDGTHCPGYDYINDGDSVVCGTVGVVTNSVSNLNHLEGQTVAILADGEVLDQQVVVDGSITFPASYAQVHVGLPFVSDLETRNIEIPLDDGTVQGRKVKIGNVVFRLMNSRGGWLGPNEDTLYEGFPDAIIDKLQTTDPQILITDDIRMPLGAGYEDGGRLFVRQRDPLPITINAVVPEVSFGGATA